MIVGFLVAPAGGGHCRGVSERDSLTPPRRVRRSSEAQGRVAFALTLRHLELELTGKDA